MSLKEIFMKKTAPYDGKLKTFEFSSSGDDIGSSFYISISVIDNKCVINYQRCEGNGFDTITKKKTVDNETMKRVEELIVDCKMPEWGALPKEEVFALDAPTDTVSIVYNDKSFTYSSGNVFPQNGWKNIGEIKSLLESKIIKK